ncbi:MAG: 4-hydroxy-3-methylbut-2-enyl diphosphate reductase [Chloroflexi bacterium]|nr:4-hydroxy-3-methylbut-2-enyl diphosphate reductase [Chloroflexota bacterium]
MEVIKVTPRGYCYGVVDAIQLAVQVATDPRLPKPVFVLGQIVHNRHAVERLRQYGITTLDGADRLALLDQIPKGTVVFTAHGISPAVKEKARQKGLHCVDATCLDVTRTHDLVKSLVARGYEIIYIGRKGHPEPAGVVGEALERIHLIQDREDIANLKLEADRIAITTQTTLSKWDTAQLIQVLLECYPNAEVYNEICSATQQRQEAVVQQSQDADLVIVVGDVHSNNSNRLVQVVQELAGKPSYLVDNVQEVKPEWLKGRKRVAVTAGSSTPSEITREVIRFLERYDEEDPEVSVAAVEAS